MSEYSEKSIVLQNLSDVPGGHEDTSGILIEKLQEHPIVCYC